MLTGNGRANNKLTRKGAEMDQTKTTITHKIVKAKIKNKRWTVENQEAADIYQSRRGPRFDVEAQ